MTKYVISDSKKYILAALLLAVYIVLDRILTSAFLKVNLSLIPVMVAAIILGWKYSTLVAGLGDFIGSICIPSGGAYFPGFTLTAIIVGIILGLFLYENPNKEKKYFELKLISSNILVNLVMLFLNAIWLMIIAEKAYIYFITTRAILYVIAFIINVVTIIILERTLKNPIKKYLYTETVGDEKEE